MGEISLSRPVEHPIIHLMIAALIAGCAPQQQESAGGSGHAHLGVEEAIMADGYRLPLRRWNAPERPRALVLALHGFGDYSNGFATLGP